MTYQEFKDSNYRIDTAAWYAAIDAEPAADVRNALIEYCTQYKMLDAIRTLETSKAKNKPIHYKAVKDIISSCNDDRLRLCISAEWYVKKMLAGFDWNYDINRIYLNADGNNIIDWENPTKAEFTPRTINEIRDAVKSIIDMNRQFKEDIKSLKEDYDKKRAAYSNIFTMPRLWVEIKG